MSNSSSSQADCPLVSPGAPPSSQERVSKQPLFIAGREPGMDEQDAQLMHSLPVSPAISGQHSTIQLVQRKYNVATASALHQGELSNAHVLHSLVGSLPRIINSLSGSQLY